jgi:hypothetical protein
MFRKIPYLLAALALCLLTGSLHAQPIQPPLSIGQFDIAHAPLHYRNPQSGADLDAAQTRALVARLYQTQAMNQAQIDAALQLQGNEARGQGFMLASPYFPQYQGQDLPLPQLRQAWINGKLVHNPEGYAQTQEGYRIHGASQRVYYGQKPVAAWYAQIRNGGAAAQEVCTVHFEDKLRQTYRLQTFANAGAAQAAGWTITHQYHCGACSSLQDLAVYIGLPDLTAPARLCAKRGYGRNANLGKVKACIEQSMGLTPACAESWAYNAMHTAQNCMGVCLQTYGGASGEGTDLLARAKGAYQLLLQEKFESCPPQVPSTQPAIRQVLARAGCPLANENTGKLNACLWCDERISGPGFKYQAARTRRNSGLESEIPRDNDQLFYTADHSRYFSVPKP